MRKGRSVGLSSGDVGKAALFVTVNPGITLARLDQTVIFQGWQQQRIIGQRDAANVCRSVLERPAPPSERGNR
jgi:hypothetical protein